MRAPIYRAPPHGSKECDATVIEMTSLENEWERRVRVTVAMRTLAAIKPAHTVAVADEFGAGRDDGFLEHIVSPDQRN